VSRCLDSGARGCLVAWLLLHQKLLLVLRFLMLLHHLPEGLQFGMRRGYYLEYLEPTRMNQGSNGGIINKLTKLQDVYLFQVDLIKLSRR
jgi:hypothetical protein